MMLRPPRPQKQAYNMPTKRERRQLTAHLSYARRTVCLFGPRFFVASGDTAATPTRCCPEPDAHDINLRAAEGGAADSGPCRCNLLHAPASPKC